ncbi:hypothetical protein E4U11_006743, partial [Claviceps purpurea]
MTGDKKQSFVAFETISGSTLCQTNWLSQTVWKVSYHSPHWLTLESLNGRVGKFSVMLYRPVRPRSRRNAPGQDPNPSGLPPLPPAPPSPAPPLDLQLVERQELRARLAAAEAASAEADARIAPASAESRASAAT